MLNAFTYIVQKIGYNEIPILSRFAQKCLRFIFIHSHFNSLVFFEPS